MLEKLQSIENKYLELESLISDPDVMQDMDRWQRYSKEHASLAPIVEKVREYKKVCSGLEDTRAMLDESLDDEMRKLVEEELTGLKARKEVLDGEMPLLLLPKDPNDDKSVIVEIRGGVGGEEAALFAGDLSACIPAMRRNRAGRWRSWTPMPRKSGASRRFPSLWMAMVPTAS